LRGVFIGLFIYIFFSLTPYFLFAQGFHESFTDESSWCEDCHKALQEYKGRYDEYCLFCHDGAIAPDVKKSFSGKYRHLKNGYQCLSCHSPHASISENPYLLKREGKENNEEYCLTCHFENEATSATYLSMYKRGFHAQKKKEKELSCLNCHTGHSSDAPNLLKIERKANFTASDLCLSCHKEVGSEFRETYAHSLESTVPSKNTPTTVECTDCHNPHFVGRKNPLGSWGVNKNLQPVRISTKEYEVCFKCHSSYAAQPPFQLNLRTLFDPQNPSYHPLLARGKNKGIKKEAFVGKWNEASILTCSDCHGSGKSRSVHGSSNPSLLKSFTDMEKPPQGKEVCFICHNSRAYLTTSTLSRLPSHGLHSKKFSCLICHESHGSDKKALIRESFTYSGERYRILFELNDKEGSCGTVPAGVCHDVLSYKRAY
jgi:predicted CXXCH cytochrome family protein